VNDEQRAKAMAFLSDPAKVDALVADIDADYRRPDYPREMLVDEVARLREENKRLRDGLSRSWEWTVDL
jgi:hypothetical protein